VLAEVRKAKSDAQASMRAEVDSLTVSGDSAFEEQVRAAEADLLAAARAGSIDFSEGEPSVHVTLSED
jgi:valyl-tRNA synthetase